MNSSEFLKTVVYLLCGVFAHVMLYMWSVNSLCRFILSFYHVGSRDRTQVGGQSFLLFWKWHGFIVEYKDFSYLLSLTVSTDS